MSKLIKADYVAPSQWASYLINGDDSGMESDDMERCTAWLKRLGHGMPVTCEDEGFCRNHDAWPESPYASDCQNYTFLIPELPFIIRRKYFADSKAWELFAVFPTIAGDSSNWYGMQATAENGDIFTCSHEYFAASRHVRGFEPARVAKFRVHNRESWEHDSDFPCVLREYQRNHASFADKRKAGWQRGRG